MRLLGVAHLPKDLLVRGEPFEVPEATRASWVFRPKARCRNTYWTPWSETHRRFCWTDSTCRLLGLRSWQDFDLNSSAVPFVALDLETTVPKRGSGTL